MQIWVKNFNQSSIMYLYVLQSYQNLFNANGYLGYNREYFNAPNVFKYATDFSNLNGWTTYSLGSNSKQIINSSGLNITQSDIVSNITYNPSNSVLYFSQKTEFTQKTTNYNHKTGFDIGNEKNPYESTYFLNDGDTQWLTQNLSNYILINMPSNLNIKNFNTYSIWTNQTSAFYNVLGITTVNSVDFTLNKTSNIYIYSGSPNDTYLTSYVLIASSISNYIDMPTYSIEGGSVFQANSTADNYNINIAYNHQNITVPSGNWYNVSLKAYSNYSYSFYYNDFPMYFNYSGLINNTFYTGFLDRNVTISLNFIGDYYTGKTSMIILEGKQ